MQFSKRVYFHIYDRDANGKRRGIDILQDSSGADEYENVADGAIILMGSKLDDTSIESSSQFKKFFGGAGISLYKSAGNASGPVVGKLVAGAGGRTHKTKDIKITTFSKLNRWLKDTCDSKLKDYIDSLVKESLPSNSESGKYFSELLKLGNDMGHSGEVAKAFINWKDGSDYLLGFINDDDSRLVTDKKTPYPIYDPNNAAISADNMITGGGLNNWRMVGYACGILDINELAKSSTGTTTKIGVTPVDQTEHSKVVKIYLDKEGDEMRQTGYFEI